MVHMGTGNGIGETGGRANTDDQCHTSRIMQTLSLCFQVILTDFSFSYPVA